MKRRPDPTVLTTTLWDFPSQNYGAGRQGDTEFRGATPSYIVWNLLQRYTRPKDLVVDPFCGSGTTLDVARDHHRRALGYDLQPTRRDIFRADARDLPLEDGTADFVFADPPYSDHLVYSDDSRCIGRLSAFGDEYFAAMDDVFAEWERILKPDRYLALYVSDSREQGSGFAPIGTRLFALLSARFNPVDHIAVVRHNRDLERGSCHRAAAEHNTFLRGFTHLLICAKGAPDDRR